MTLDRVKVRGQWCDQTLRAHCDIRDNRELGVVWQDIAIPCSSSTVHSWLKHPLKPTAWCASAWAALCGRLDEAQRADDILKGTSNRDSDATVKTNRELWSPDCNVVPWQPPFPALKMRPKFHSQSPCVFLPHIYVQPTTTHRFQTPG